MRDVHALRMMVLGAMILGLLAACGVGELEGSRVTTIEGLGGRHPVQQAWVAEQATQCGFCEPGFIMATAALVDSGRPIGAGEIDSLPNVCRCGAYPRIRKAIERAARSAPR